MRSQKTKRVFIIRKNLREVIRVEHGIYRGRKFTDVRLWFWSEGGKLRPTMQGVRFGDEVRREVRAALRTPKKRRRGGS